ncbi:hypothetical protein [Hyphomicrobium sp. 2TAF46]
MIGETERVCTWTILGKFFIDRIGCEREGAMQAAAYQFLLRHNET